MIGKRVIVDTDILSMFAKVDAVDVLEEFLGTGRAAMTSAIRDEISIPLQYGYTFPNSVLSRIPVVPLTGRAWEEEEYDKMARAVNPYGDGRASERIVAALLGEPIEDWGAPTSAGSHVVGV